MIKRGILLVIFLAITLILAGCSEGKVRYGEAISKNVKVVKLKEIMKNLEGYKDHKVMLEGNFGGACCSTDFFYKEGLEMVEVYPKGFLNPKLKIGNPIRIYGIVKVIERKINLKKNYIIYLEAKGVEVR